ncbi:MAG TPA: autotransporter assembly complex family protein [Methylophilaceae bacterium]|nr:autotransporter assembly complex family protein [Methylophilaceae bacterium]
MRIAPHLSSRCLQFLLPLLLLCLSALANAAYEVNITAPKPLNELLTQFLDLSRYKNRNDLNEDQFNFMMATAEEQVAELVATEGYFSPITHVDVEHSNGKRIVNIRVDPGPRTHISKVELDVQGAALQRSPQQVERLIKEWPLVRGEAFRQQEWDEAKESSLQQLRNHLYAAAEIRDAQARVYADRQQAELSVEYDSGPAFTLGPLNVTGARRYPESIVHNINPLKPGEPYNADRLLALQRQIQRTPYYSNAVIDIERDPDTADGTPVTVNVTEFPTQRISAGVGYSTDTGASVEGRYSHNDVFNRAWVFDSRLKIEQERQLANLNLAMPPDRTGFVNAADFAYERTTLEGVDLRSLRYGLWRSRTSDTLDLAFKLQYYSDRLERLNGAEIPDDIIVQPGDHKALVTSVEWTHRKVDDLTFPRSGYIVSNYLGVAVKGLLTDETFFRAASQVRKFIPVRQRDLLILGASLGAVFSQGDNTSVPASLLFRAGGTETIRGYDYLSIGNEINGTVYPTRYLATGTIEYQYWFLPEWGAAVFYDVGTATDNWADKEIFHGVGLGARWRSPVGPIRADLGYGIQRGEVRPHFSLGILF